MKKLTLALSFACAGALAFADSEQWQTSWFSGIGSDVTAISDMKATNGTWDSTTLKADYAEISSDGVLVLDLDDGLEAKFTVTDAATDAKTAQKISVTGVFTPIAFTDLPSADVMGSTGTDAKNAQLGFAVVSTTTTSENDSSTTTTAYTYQAWVGGDNWVTLGTCADKDATTALTVTFAYWDSSVTATFAISNGGSAVNLGNNATQTLTGNALEVAQANYKVSSVACTGSGTLSALTGDAQYAVASVNGRNYGTLADAVANAGNNTVTLERNTTGEAVTIDSGSTVKIDDNGKSASIVNNGTMNIEVKDSTSESGVASGEYEYKISDSGSGEYKVTLNDESKEATVEKGNGKVTVTVRTAESVLNAIKIEGANLKSNVSNLRTFLAANCSESYTKANTTADAIATALKETGNNNLTKWQSYALGIATDATLAPTYASDTDDKNVTLKLAPSAGAISPSGDYTVSYDVYNGETKKATSESADAIKVPLATGRYTVKVVFTAPES